MKSYTEITNKIIYNDFIEYLKQYININFVDKFSIWNKLPSNAFTLNEIFIGTDNNKRYYFLKDSLYLKENRINVYMFGNMTSKEFTSCAMFIPKTKIVLKPRTEDNLFHLNYIKDLNFNEISRIIKKDVVENDSV